MIMVNDEIINFIDDAYIDKDNFLVDSLQLKSDGSKARELPLLLATLSIETV